MNGMPPCWVQGQPLNACAQDLFRRDVERSMRLPDPWWKGWRVREHKLHGPGGIVFVPRSLETAWSLLQSTEPPLFVPSHLGPRL